MPQTVGDSPQCNELQTSSPECRSEISDMVSSHELGDKVESLSHEINTDQPVLPESFISAQPPSSQRPNFKPMRRKRLLNLVQQQKILGKMK
ncbi:hypothetical protein O181_063528 [Austropuccinia psidii MF-1]|uniref:Uncharacterized protein n=1 Tax=Austropuccinia psidii MF-1 TaxID=1389203 RepID=A0A9Q3ERT7_9BASI|nr:hypothetical protein [Austropuccinia psidii MF-1]